MKPPKKPRPDFPLSPVGNGQWRKVVNRRPYYFGSWREDPRGDAALKDWLTRKDAIYAGLDTGQGGADTSPGLEVAELITRYLTERSKDVTAKKLSPTTFANYSHALNSFAATLPPKAKAAKALRPKFGEFLRHMERRGLGPHAIKRTITMIKTAFGYAASEGWIDPIPFPNSFSAPSTDSESVAMWHAKREETDKTSRVLNRAEVRRLLRGTRKLPKWRAMVLLMLNTAMNPAELARLKWSDIDFKSGRLSRRRWKTGILLECYLWNMTRAALRYTVNTSDLVFTRPNGKPLVGNAAVYGEQVTDVVTRVRYWNRISRVFIDICERLKLDGVTPYTLRRTARTLAAHCHDDNAAKRMMGQRLEGQDKTYVKGPFPLARLKRLSLTIAVRLFGSKPKPKMRLVKDAAA